MTRLAPTGPASLRLARAPVTAPSGSGILRTRLLRRLDGLLDARLAAVLGPPGTGKTTLMAQWARRAPVDIAWHRADTVDDDPTVLMRHLAAAIGQVSARTPTGLEGLLDLLDRRDSPLVLVVDDLQVVRGVEALGVLQCLVDLLPPQVHLLLGSRGTLPFNLTRTEVPSVLVDAAELRFRSDEVERLFASYGTPLDQPDCLRLTRHSEGWAAALRLFHRQVANLAPHERHAAVLGLAGQVRYAREYVGREVLAPLPSEHVALLRSASVLELLSGRRCELLLGTPGHQPALAELEQAGVLTASSAGNGFFRLPTVVRAHLHTQLCDTLTTDGLQRQLERAAAAIAADPGPDGPAETVRMYAAAGSWPQVLEVLARDGEGVLGVPDLDWVESAPPALAAREPWLRLAAGTRALRDGRLEATVALATLPDDAVPPAAAAATSRRLLRQARQWTEGDLEPGEWWLERLRAELRRPGRGARDLPRTAEQSLLAAIGLALAGDLRSARERLDGCLLSLHHDPLTSLAGQLVAEVLTPGDGTGALALADRAESWGMPWFSRMARGLADAVAPGDPVALAQRVRDAEHRGDAWGALLLAGLRAVVLLRAGAAAPAHLEDLVARCHALDCPTLEAWARSGLALASAAGKVPDAAREGRSAEGYARSAAVPGAVAVAYGALAVSLPDDAADLRVLAETEADALGLDWRPWTWLEAPAGTGPRPPVRVVEPTTVEIRCFGGFELLLEGAPPPLTRVRPKARALLRMLAISAGRPVHRESVVDALWPDLDAAAGTHNLQVAVSSLRTLLEPGVRRGASTLLVRDGDRYTLRLLGASSCDVGEFEDALVAADRARADGLAADAVPALEESLRVYRGDLLPEDGPAEWVTGPRDHHRLRAAEAAATLAELLLGRDQPERAAAAALRSIDIDPCRDGSWRLLVAAYRASGDMAAAERTRRSYVEVLDSLGVVSGQVRAVRPGARSS